MTDLKHKEETTVWQIIGFFFSFLLMGPPNAMSKTRLLVK